ncbi:unnamed protein product [Protopolystoma xenopodis]|uniref:Uncharacterized protein n=1 Tax=Protopolystoma xenopodis TaxID=117903 RepID=A0A448X2C1_9PLAT|nr:unnamed protein product [Protopolystoma xenopodis]
MVNAFSDSEILEPTAWVFPLENYLFILLWREYIRSTACPFSLMLVLTIRIFLIWRKAILTANFHKLS